MMVSFLLTKLFQLPPSLDVSLVDGGLGITGIPSRRRFSNGVR